MSRKFSWFGILAAFLKFMILLSIMRDALWMIQFQKIGFASLVKHWGKDDKASTWQALTIITIYGCVPDYISQLDQGNWLKKISTLSLFSDPGAPLVSICVVLLVSGMLTSHWPKKKIYQLVL